MCSVDTNLEILDPVNFTTTGWGDLKYCRNYDEVFEFAEKWANSSDTGVVTWIGDEDWLTCSTLTYDGIYKKIWCFWDFAMIFVFERPMSEFENKIEKVINDFPWCGSFDTSEYRWTCENMPGAGTWYISSQFFRIDFRGANHHGNSMNRLTRLGKYKIDPKTSAKGAKHKILTKHTPASSYIKQISWHFSRMNFLLFRITCLNCLTCCCTNEIITMSLILHFVSNFRVKNRYLLTRTSKSSMSTIFDLAQVSNASQFTHSWSLYTLEVGSPL